MLRSHHLCCMAIHTEETCEVRSFRDLGMCVPGVWRRCKLLIPPAYTFPDLWSYGLHKFFLCVLPYSTDDEISTSNHSFL